MKNNGNGVIYAEIDNESGYTLINKTLIYDKEISSDAFRAQVYLLGHSKRFKFSYFSIQNNFGFSKSKVGRIITELKKAGYIEIKPIKNGGNFAGYSWIIKGKSSAVLRSSGEPNTTDDGSSGKPNTQIWRYPNMKIPKYEDTSNNYQSLININDKELINLSDTPKTAYSENSHVSNNLPTNFENKTETDSNKQKNLGKKNTSKLKDIFEKETDSNLVCKFLLSFCRFINTPEDRANLRKNTVMGVRSEAKRLLDQGVDIQQLENFKRWYETTFAGTQRKKGAVLGFGYIRENLAAFKASCAPTQQNGGDTTFAGINNSDGRLSFEMSEDRETVTILDNWTGDVMRKMSVQQFNTAYSVEIK